VAPPAAAAGMVVAEDVVRQGQ